MTNISRFDVEGVEPNTRWFQNRIADVRLSQRRVAKHLGLDPAAVSLMIRGKRKMSAAEAAELARLLGVTVNDVMHHAGIAKVEYFESRPVKALVAPPPPESAPIGGSETLDLPVPMSDGTTALVRIPRKLTKADADRIAAVVQALSVP